MKNNTFKMKIMMRIS